MGDRVVRACAVVPRCNWWASVYMTGELSNANPLDMPGHSGFVWEDTPDEAGHIFLEAKRFPTNNLH